LGWRPWHYDHDRLTRKVTTTMGGPRHSLASIQGWRAEFFVPYALLKPLQNVPPKPGARWRANFYRMDHDDGKRTQWGWAQVGNSFPEDEKFGTVLFGSSGGRPGVIRPGWRSPMWSRRHFLETLSGVPLIGGFIGASALPTAAMAAGKSRDCVKGPGVRPFI